jgi:connector enhancer of kinase suppressor of Ras 2
MAYINVYDWKSDQVIEWLKGNINKQLSGVIGSIIIAQIGFSFFSGLEYTNGLYIQAFANNQIDGRQLLNLRPYELEELGIVSIGHQESILEAVEHLKNFVRKQNSIFIDDRK